MTMTRIPTPADIRRAQQIRQQRELDAEAEQQAALERLRRAAHEGRLNRVTRKVAKSDKPKMKNVTLRVRPEEVVKGDYLITKNGNRLIESFDLPGDSLVKIKFKEGDHAKFPRYERHVRIIRRVEA